MNPTAVIDAITAGKFGFALLRDAKRPESKGREWFLTKLALTLGRVNGPADIHVGACCREAGRGARRGRSFTSRGSLLMFMNSLAPTCVSLACVPSSVAAHSAVSEAPRTSPGVLLCACSYHSSPNGRSLKDSSRRPSLTGDDKSISREHMRILWVAGKSARRTAPCLRAKAHASRMLWHGVLPCFGKSASEVTCIRGGHPSPHPPRRDVVHRGLLEERHSGARLRPTARSTAEDTRRSLIMPTTKWPPER